MADVLTPTQRKLNMSRVRGKDTKPELLLRRGLHSRGLRFRLHRRDLPGRPDLVFPRHKTCLFVHGCFWHGHSCELFRLPATRPEFWKLKIDGTRLRDRKAVLSLLELRWRVIVVWECAVRGPSRRSVDEVLDACVKFIRCKDRNDEGETEFLQIESRQV